MPLQIEKYWKKIMWSFKGLFLFTALILGLVATTALRAEQAPIGQWNVRHGALYIDYSFTPNGTYAYQRHGNGIFDEETGSYSVQGNNLILQPDGKPQRALRWWIGADPVIGERVLWLVDNFGRKEMFYAQ